MGLRDVRRVQDSVHGLMEFKGTEAVVVDILRTAELQRLRRIRQLGLAHYVFPGAEHTRFTHSLGAAHLALRFAHQIRAVATHHFVPTLVPDEYAIADLALAALCHDLGHGPLSHAWEREVIGETFDRAAWVAALGLSQDNPIAQHGKWHEMVGQALLGWEGGELHEVLEDHEVHTASRIAGLLAGEYYLPYLPRLLSSDVDVDRADFIMRDTHQTGVAYGRFDLNWLLSTCALGRLDTTRGEWAIGFERRKALRVVEQFLIARRALYETVYQHKTVRCIEGMVALLLRRLKEVVRAGADSEVLKTDLLSPFIRMMKGEALSPKDLLKVDDFSLFFLIEVVAAGSTGDRTAIDLSQRIRSRDLFKLVPVASEAIAQLLTEPDRLEELHHAIQPFVPGPSKYYMVWDSTVFRMFSDDQNSCALFISDDGIATPVQDDPLLVAYRNPQVTQRRLFTVRPAIDAAMRAIVS